MPSLSICIPTYNRSACLAELLDSIVAQGMPVEVIVSDDASPDDTAKLVPTYADRLPGLTFLHQKTNLGLDRNFLAVVEAATGDYVWLMGDDDRLEPGAIATVLEALDGWPGVGGLTVGVIDYDPTMTRPTGIRQMPPTQRMHGTAAVFGEIADLLGFMSALIVDRRKWDQVCREDPIADYENYYVQVYIVGRVIERFGDWGVLNTPCVGFRTSNDQFLSKFGWLKRLKIDVIAYEQIADGLFAHDRRAHRALRERTFATHILARIRNAKTGEGPTPELWAAVRLLFHHYRDLPGFWLTALPTLAMPNWALRKLRLAYRRYSRSSGAARARRLAS